MKASETVRQFIQENNRPTGIDRATRRATLRSDNTVQVYITTQELFQMDSLCMNTDEAAKRLGAIRLDNWVDVIKEIAPHQRIRYFRWD